MYPHGLQIHAGLHPLSYPESKWRALFHRHRRQFRSLSVQRMTHGVPATVLPEQFPTPEYFAGISKSIFENPHHGNDQAHILQNISLQFPWFLQGIPDGILPDSGPPGRSVPAPHEHRCRIPPGQQWLPSILSPAVRTSGNRRVGIPPACPPEKQTAPTAFHKAPESVPVKWRQDGIGFYPSQSDRQCSLLRLFLFHLVQIWRDKHLLPRNPTKLHPVPREPASLRRTFPPIVCKQRKAVRPDNTPEYLQSHRRIHRIFPQIPLEFLPWLRRSEAHPFHEGQSVPGPLIRL